MDNEDLCAFDCPNGCLVCHEELWQEHKDEMKLLWDDCSLEREEAEREIKRRLGILPPICKLCEGFGCAFCPPEGPAYPPMTEEI